MRTSLWLAAVALCLGAGSSVHGGRDLHLNPFAPSNGTTVQPAKRRATGSTSAR